MHSATLQKIITTCGGFLLGVLWMDLLFDTQLLRAAPESAVPTISAYYLQATTVAYPMNRLIALVMLITLATAVHQLVQGRIARRVSVATLLLAGAPIVLAIARVVPNAMRLGAQAGSFAEQVDIAQGILRDHVGCLALVAAFVVIQIAVRPPSPER